MSSRRRRAPRSKRPESLPPGEDWRDYRRQVTEGLEELTRESREQLEKIGDLKEQLAVLKRTVSLYAGAAGFVSAAIVSIATQLLSMHFGK